MTAYLFTKLASAIVSIALGSGILARDPGLAANRLIASFLFCNAWWAGCEFMFYQNVDASEATMLLRAMSPGWIPLGVLCAHASVSLSGVEDRLVTRLIFPCYVAVGLVLPIAMFTSWVVVDAERTPLGFRADYGIGMIVAYLLMAAPLVGVLGCWRGLLRRAQVGGQAQLARVIFFGLSTSLVAGTLTAIVLPLSGIPSLGVTTLLVTLVGIASAWTLRRFGHSLIAPEAFAREILDTLEDGVILVGEGGALRDVNRAFLRMVGVRDASALGKSVASWLPEIPERLQDFEASRFMELVTRGGDRVPVVVSAPVACMDGARLFGHALILRDRREIVSLQRQLLVSARLAAVGDLSKSITDSINEPVARAREEFEGLSIDWQTAEDVLELAGVRNDCSEALEEGRELIAECVEGVERIVSIVREVGGFSSEGESERFASHDFDQIVRRAVRIAQVHAPEGLVIEARLDPDVKILGHFSELERVVTNLLVNAIHALEGRAPGEGHIVVALATQDDRALLHVEDDGCGIEIESLDRIFDPFFTTKPVGKGTGLGLAISYHIVKAHGGEIRVSSVPERGTSVAVILPRAPCECA